MSDVTLLNNRYLIEEQIGKGGMALVYKGQDLLLERTVAVKVLREDFSVDVDFRERFCQEAKAATNLSHPNIVTVHDFGLDEGRLFIVMECVPGKDLNTMLRKRGHFTPRETISLIVQACAGVGYAHRTGLVHCDIKPNNMLVTPDKRLKVTAFGIARALAAINSNARPELVWGSPQFLAPEQADGGVLSPSSDVYGLGVVLYEMLTGQLPFECRSREDMVHMHQAENPVTPSIINPDIPPVLDHIILKVLSREPSARYRTADQLGRVLETFTESANTTLVPVSNSTGVVTEFEPIPADEFIHSPQQSAISPFQDRDYLDIDWIAVVLGLLAFIAVGGLIPFWIWVYFVFNPPVR